MPSSVTAFSDMAPSPRVMVDIDDADLNPLTVTALIMQVSVWGEVPVENTPRPVAGGLVVTDYTVPPGVQVVYRVRQFDAAGADLGLALSLDAQVEWDPGMVVISDPLAPRDAVMVGAEVSYAGTLTRSRPVARYRAGSKTFAMSGLYSAFEEVPLRCFTSTASDRETLGRILEQPMILVRSMPQTRLPGSFFASIASTPMLPWDAHDGEDTDVWDLVGSELSRPTVDVLVPIYSYELYKQFLDAKYPPEATYDDAAQEYSTYIEALRNPPPVV